jgi:hypothetical protein
VIETLRRLYEKIPKKWRKSLLTWSFSFLVGLLITQIWGVDTLLVILLLFFAIFFFIYEFGIKRARIASEWAIGEYFRRVRGAIIFALFPTFIELFKDFSLDSIFALIILIFVTLTIWRKFDEIIEDLCISFFGKRKHRR